MKHYFPNNTIQFVALLVMIIAMKGVKAQDLPEDQSFLYPGDDLNQKIKQNFFLKGTVTKTTCYVGEALEATFKAYSRLNASSQVVRRPSFNGFSVVDMVDQYDNRARVEEVNGKPFYYHLIRQVQLFPLQEGIYFVDEAEIESEIHFIKYGRTKIDNPLTGLLKDAIGPLTPEPMLYAHQLNLKTTAFPVTVLPLPELDKPANFTGAVGNFQLSVSIPEQELVAGVPFEVEVTVSGYGNFPLLILPKYNLNKDWVFRETEITERTNKNIYPLSGNKRFGYSLMLHSTGNFTFPSLDFTYFDPEKEAYVQLNSDPVNFQVLAKKNTGNGQPVTEGQALHHGKQQKPYRWFIPIAVLVILIIGYQLMKGFKEKSTETKLPQPQSPNVLKPITLEGAQMALEKGDFTLFLHYLQSAIWLAADRAYDMPEGKRSKVLLAQQAGEFYNLEIKPLLDQIEWMAYTPDHEDEALRQMLNKTNEVIKKLGRK